jgi:hypothetical protein
MPTIWLSVNRDFRMGCSSLPGESLLLNCLPGGEAYAGAKVLFMSAYSVHQVEVYRVKLASGEPFLKKPFTMDELQRAVKAALVYRPPSTRPRTSSRG